MESLDYQGTEVNTTPGYTRLQCWGTWGGARKVRSSYVIGREGDRSPDIDLDADGHVILSNVAEDLAASLWDGSWLFAIDGTWTWNVNQFINVLYPLFDLVAWDGRHLILRSKVPTNLWSGAVLELSHKGDTDAAIVP